MNLVQKMPIGLGLACLLMLSSCSKEDVSAPQPQVGEISDGSGLRQGTGIVVLPQIAPTNGETGLGIYAEGWCRNSVGLPVPNNILPSGTSSLTHLWGDQTLPWSKPLSPVPGIPNTGSVITILAQGPDVADNASIAEATFKNLKPGKHYQITVYMAGTTRNTFLGQSFPAYPSSVIMALSSHKTDTWTAGVSSTHSSNLPNGATWVKETIYLHPETSEGTISFLGRTSQQNQYGYVNIYLDKSCIKEVLN